MFTLAAVFWATRKKVKRRRAPNSGFVNLDKGTHEHTRKLLGSQSFSIPDNNCTMRKGYTLGNRPNTIIVGVCVGLD